MALKLKIKATLTKIKTYNFIMAFIFKLRWTPHTPLSKTIYMTLYMTLRTCYNTKPHINLHISMRIELCNRSHNFLNRSRNKCHDMCFRMSSYTPRDSCSCNLSPRLMLWIVQSASSLLPK